LIAFGGTEQAKRKVPKPAGCAEFAKLLATTDSRRRALLWSNSTK